MDIISSIFTTIMIFSSNRYTRLNRYLGTDKTHLCATTTFTKVKYTNNNNNFLAYAYFLRDFSKEKAGFNIDGCRFYRKVVTQRELQYRAVRSYR